MVDFMVDFTVNGFVGFLIGLLVRGKTGEYLSTKEIEWGIA